MAGIVDGEGSITNPPKPAGGARAVCITNTDPALIEACCACCDRLGLTYRIHTVRKAKAHHLQAWTFVISTHTTLKVFAQKVPIIAPKKRRNLEILLRSYRRPPYEIEPTQALLHRLYVVEKRTYEQIRVHVGARSHGTVRHWLKKHGIRVDRKKLIRRPSPPLSTLRKLYLVEGMTAKDIAKRYKLPGNTTVAKWLNDAGIHRRSRGKSRAK